jgi:hypothetical protein
MLPKNHLSYFTVLLASLMHSRFFHKQNIRCKLTLINSIISFYRYIKTLDCRALKSLPCPRALEIIETALYSRSK